MHDFKAAHVLVVGDVMLDEYVVGAVSRISPEAPVPVLDVRSRYVAAGGAANVALNIASLGAKVSLLGVVGSDAAGSQLRELLRAHSVSDAHMVEAPGRGTISKTRIIAGQQQICRMDHEDRSTLSAELTDKLLHVFKSALDPCQVVILSDYAKGVLSEEFCGEIIRLAHVQAKQTIVDPKSKDFQKYLGCSVITPNLPEASAASGVAIDSEASLLRAGAELRSQLPGTAILITRGSEGMALFEPRVATAVTIATQARKVFDVVGAGDTVAAMLAVALAAEYPLAEAVSLANLAAGIAVEKPGTATVTIDEINARYLPRS